MTEIQEIEIEIVTEIEIDKGTNINKVIENIIINQSKKKSVI
jgi:hypothetical protein